MLGAWPLVIAKGGPGVCDPLEREVASTDTGGHYMDLWHETRDDIFAIVRDAGENLTIDQRIAIAQVHAMLSVAQELSSLNPQNSSYRDKDGQARNGWGLLKGTDDL
jgi:hypothetical protein